MRIAIIGSTHPYKGGIALHTTKLAWKLSEAGHDVKIYTWKDQYPFFYPGEQYVADGVPETEIYPNVESILSWKNPLTWTRVAHNLAGYHQVIFIWWVPMIQGPIYRTILFAAGKFRPKVTVLCHNVIQHSSSVIDKLFTKSIFDNADELIVHTEKLAELVASISKTRVTVSAMPAHFPGIPTRQKIRISSNKQLLFFGLVRQYKGVDMLIKALSSIKDVKLIIYGEFWGKQEQIINSLVSELGLESRVIIVAGYVPVKNLQEIFADCDALVLPYRSGTATQNVKLANAYGRPVIATNVGSMPEDILNNVDGIICDPDEASISQAIRHFYEPGVASKLTEMITVNTSEKDWDNYLRAIL